MHLALRVYARAPCKNLLQTSKPLEKKSCFHDINASHLFASSGTQSLVSFHSPSRVLEMCRRATLLAKKWYSRYCNIIHDDALNNRCTRHLHTLTRLDFYFYSMFNTHILYTMFAWKDSLLMAYQGSHKIRKTSWMQNRISVVDVNL